MKTIIKVETTDQERAIIARHLGIKGMISRKDLTSVILGAVASLSTDDQAAPISGETDRQRMMRIVASEPAVLAKKDAVANWSSYVHGVATIALAIEQGELKR